MVEEPTRKLAALLHADVVGSTALVQLNEAVAHQRIQDTFRRLSEIIATHGGIAHEIRGVRSMVRVGIAMGEVVVADNTQGLPFVYRNLGDHTLKGFEVPVRAYAVSQESHTTITLSETAEPDVSVAFELSDKPSIAVLPFANMSGDPEQEYFSDGITEDIITELPRFRELFVDRRGFTKSGQTCRACSNGTRADRHQGL